jgi:hypothetical protein
MNNIPPKLLLIKNKDIEVERDFYFVSYDSLTSAIKIWTKEENHKKPFIVKALKQSLRKIYSKKVPLKKRQNLYPGRYHKLLKSVVRYCIRPGTSTSEIAVLLYFTTRFMADRGYGRFKIKYCVQWSGFSDKQLRLAVKKLIAYEILAFHKLHPNLVIAHGRKFSYGPGLISFNH